MHNLDQTSIHMSEQHMKSAPTHQIITPPFHFCPCSSVLSTVYSYIFWRTSISAAKSNHFNHSPLSSESPTSWWVGVLNTLIINLSYVLKLSNMSYHIWYDYLTTIIQQVVHIFGQHFVKDICQKGHSVLCLMHGLLYHPIQGILYHTKRKPIRNSSSSWYRSQTTLYQSILSCVPTHTRVFRPITR